MFGLKSLAAIIAVVYTSTAAQAAPLKRADAITDIQILNYALTLEHLENAFYSGALAKFDSQTFSDAGMNRSFFEEIASHENEHVTFLATALGDAATKACNYSFPYTDIKGFAALSMVLEGVGVSAYLGAAGSIINKAYLTAAGSILTTEARHAAYVSTVPSNAQAPWSGAFDVPLDFDQVYSLAAPFITSCPSTNPSLPVKQFPALNVTTTSYTGGSELHIAFAASGSNHGQLFMAFLSGLNTIYAPYNATSGAVTIPASLTGAGTVYAVLANATTNSTAPTDDNTVAGPAILLFPNNATTGTSSSSSPPYPNNTAENKNGASYGIRNVGPVAVAMLGVVGGLIATTL